MTLPGEVEGPEARPADFRETIDVGALAPEFVLPELLPSGDVGASISLSDLCREQPVVLFFGSFTCPPFRREIGDLSDFHRDFGSAANVVLVYVREAHPNSTLTTRDGDGKSTLETIPIDSSLEQRVSNARVFRTTFALEVPILIDELDDAVASAYGAWPNRVVVVGKGGRIKWKGEIDPLKFDINFVRTWATHNLTAN